MRNLLFTFSFVLFSFLIVNAQSELPNNAIKTLDGKSISLNDAIKEGQITIISFWATWCPPCIKELETIKALYPDWKEKYGVELLAISTDDSKTAPKVKSLVARKGWEYTILSDVNQVLQKVLNFSAMPQTFLVNKEKKIVWSHSGYLPGDEYELEEAIKAIVEK